MPKPLKKKITKTVVDKIGPNQTVWDSVVQGFGVRRQKGKPSYIVKHRVNGQQRYVTLGKHGVLTTEQARNLARITLAEGLKGNDVHADKLAARKGMTLSEAIDQFLSTHAAQHLKPKSLEQYRDTLERIAKPKLGNKRLKDMSHSEISSLHRSYKQSPYQANRVLAALSSLFSQAIEWGEIPSGVNPCLRVKKFPEVARERYLSRKELGALATALEAAWPETEDAGSSWSEQTSNNPPSPSAAAAVWLLLLTGARRDEILTLKWDYLSDDWSSARLPDSKTGTKTIYFSGEAQKVLKRIPKVLGNPYVIVGRKEGQRLVNLRKPWTRICDAAGLTDARLHDLRHTYASYGAMAGLTGPQLQNLLGHAQPQTTDRYLHLSDEPMQAANEIITEEVLRKINK